VLQLVRYANNNISQLNLVIEVKNMDEIHKRVKGLFMYNDDSKSIGLDIGPKSFIMGTIHVNHIE